ncbi:hypothetical protein [Candidatus Sororendozoicomonas aggregata]|uniref:hypothetical protein n=1 Tax=Candidatus Sororendozoicomonas aggregata TaxID=3073239 RepID=UPI002ED178AC
MQYMDTIWSDPLIKNSKNGMEIKYTDYFDTENAKKGYNYFSFIAGACRLLVPEIPTYPEFLSKMKKAKSVEVSYNAKLYDFGRKKIAGYTATFDDGTATPFSLLTPIKHSDGKPLKKDHDQKMMLIVYFEKEGKHVEVYRRKAVFKYNR